MIYSMTAYSTQSVQTPMGLVGWEIRSVNHRYLELSFKLPDTLRELEGNFRDLIRKYLRRGKVDCFLKFEAAAESSLKVNVLQVDHLLKAMRQIKEQLQDAAKISPLEILKMPSVMFLTEINISDVSLHLQNTLEDVLKNLMVERAREGSAIKILLQDRLSKMKKEIKIVFERFPVVQKTLREKLNVKLNDLKIKIDENRFEQELIYWLHKSDISEEMDRLSLHVLEVERILENDNVVGRRLDFLMQELNREANTLASKAIDMETINASIECKVLIEEMREQIQNLE